MTEREFAIDVVRTLRAAGYEALWAGGCVRDECLGLEPQDYDVATNARPEQVQALFPRTIAIGKAFGVIEVLGPRVRKGVLKIQVATFRKDIYDALTGALVNKPVAEAPAEPDGRHPIDVVFCSAEEDAQRRDFTINGMFFDPLENKLIDYVGGQEDLRHKILRAIGEPRQRFTEDKLRMLRAVRMALRFELTIEPATRAAICAMAAQLRAISAERIADELRKMLVHRRRAFAMDLLLELGLMKAVLPEAVAMKGLPQGPPSAPTGDLWGHVLRVLELLREDVSFPLAFAALLHDIGKPRCVGRTPERYTFYGHEHIGRRMAGDMALRLKLSNAEGERSAWLVEKHQILSDAPRMRQSKLKMLLAHPGIDELLELHRADALASGRSTEHVDFCRKRLPMVLPEPLLTGDDLIQLGLRPGKIFKELLDAAWEAQLEDKIKTKAEAIELAKHLLAVREQGAETDPDA
jgi:poly(A) polymerase